MPPMPPRVKPQPQPEVEGLTWVDKDAPALLPTKRLEEELPFAQEAFERTTLILGYEPILPPDKDDDFVQAYINCELSMKSLHQLAKGPTTAPRLMALVSEE